MGKPNRGRPPLLRADLMDSERWWPLLYFCICVCINYVRSQAILAQDTFIKEQGFIIAV